MQIETKIDRNPSRSNPRVDRNQPVQHIIMDQKLENSVIMCCTIISKFKINIFLPSAVPRLLSLAFDACKIGIFFDECASFLVQIVPLLCNILCYIASLSHCLLEGFTVSIFHIRDKDKNTPIVACHNGLNI